LLPRIGGGAVVASDARTAGSESSFLIIGNENGSPEMHEFDFVRRVPNGPM
jgi:hypothetical protein